MLIICEVGEFQQIWIMYSVIVLGLHPANEERLHNVTTSVIDCAHTQANPCYLSARSRIFLSSDI